jgi:uncharacterized protein
MITKTFSHITSIGAQAEQKLWDNNINDWPAFLSSENIPLPPSKVDIIRKELSLSKQALSEQDHEFFSTRLPSKEHWRLFKEFKKSTAYIDIETTGLSPEFSQITTIALYDGINIKYYINGQNLADFIKDIRQYDLIITYNGKCFDIPFIEKYFGIELFNSHIDLRFILKSLGFSGGLKNCEKQFGLSRNELDGIDGFFAVILWKEYKKGQKTALDTLLAYNIEDVINLEFLMHHAYNLKLKETFFENQTLLDIPIKPKGPFTPDLNLVKNIKKQHYWH